LGWVWDWVGSSSKLGAKVRARVRVKVRSVSLTQSCIFARPGPFLTNIPCAILYLCG